MASNTLFLNGIEGILLLRSYAPMAIHTFDDVQMMTWSFFNPDAPLSLNHPFCTDVAILTADLLDLLSMMATCTIFQKCFSVSFPGRMTVRTLQSVASYMGFMRELHIVEGHRPFFHAHMAQGRTGHWGLEFPGPVAFVDGRKGLFSLAIGHIKEFDRVLDIMNAIAQENKAVIMAGFVEKGLGLLERRRFPSGLLIIKQHLLNIEDPLIRLILRLREECLPVLQRIVESLTMTLHTGFSHCPFLVLGGMQGRLTLFSLPMAGDAVNIRRIHEAGRVRNADPSTSTI